MTPKATNLQDIDQAHCTSDLHNTMQIAPLVDELALIPSKAPSFAANDL